MADGLQRPRPRRARAGRLLQPLQRGGGAAQAGRLRLEGDLRRGRALVPQRRHLRRAVGDDGRSDHRRHAGGQGGRRGRLVRPQLPREALERRRAATSRRSRGAPSASSSTSTCWSATRRTCRRASASRARRSPPSRSSIPSAFFGMIDQRRREVPEHQVVATTLREVHSTNRHNWGAVAWIDGKTYVSADLRARRARPRRRRRRLRRRASSTACSRGEPPEESREARLGARRAADHVPRRHDDGDARPGRGFAKGGSARIQR